MPELAEVEFYRKRWALAGTGSVIRRLHANADRKVFRGTDAAALQRALTGRPLGASQTSAKQMLFRAGDSGWLGIHLGMTGELFTAPATHSPGRHDHLVLFQDERALVFRDPRMFGRILFHEGAAAPEWWSRIAPPILSAAGRRAGGGGRSPARGWSPAGPRGALRATGPGRHRRRSPRRRRPAGRNR